jgi:RHS repeat-associated protein
MLAERELEPSPLPQPAMPWGEAFGSDGPEHASKYYRSRYYDPKIGRFLSPDPIRFGGGDINLYAYVWDAPTNVVDPLGLAGTDVNLGSGYSGRVDAFDAGGRSSFEIQVYDPTGKEVGVAGPDRWINKHGFKEPPELPRKVVESLNGRVIEELRSRGQLPPKGQSDISDFLFRFLPADITLVCVLNPGVCEDLWKTIDCLLNPCKPGCEGPGPEVTSSGICDRYSSNAVPET